MYSIGTIGLEGGGGVYGRRRRGEKEEGEKWREERGGEWKQANTVGEKMLACL